MKNLIFLSFFVSSLSFAAEPPPAPCAGVVCSPRMLEIAERFEKANTIEAGTLPLLASGECYHLASYYDSTTTHHGVTLLDPHEGALYMGGSYSFFAPEDPYRTWTIEDARTQFSHLFEPNHRVELTPDFAYSDMNPGGETMWRYWVKRDEKHLYEIGQWGIYHRVFCELELR